MVDKNLFLYDLAVVAIMKNEEPYVKEWLDYHLLAGVDHFYIYDNDSTPEFKEILQPYIDANIVNYTFYPGKCRQMEAYIDAVKRFRFQCRYLAIIDGDEFIFPKSKSTIPEVVDEILNKNPEAAGLGINWCIFGSNGEEKADYSRGVLERFTKRGNVSTTIKTVFNPRRAKLFHTPHAPMYFGRNFTVTENLEIVPAYDSKKATAEKIATYHYSVKSQEEYSIKVNRGNADHFANHYKVENFSHDKFNAFFDDGIVKYRDARRDALIGKEGGIELLFARKQINPARLFNALAQNLIPTTVATTPKNFYDDKTENFLTCLNLSGYLRGKLFDDEGAKIFEELSLNALLKSLQARATIADILLLIDELPEILMMNYPAVKKIREVCVQIIPQIMTTYRLNNHWQGFTELNCILKLLKAIS